jgi:hypothetical protein
MAIWHVWYIFVNNLATMFFAVLRGPVARDYLPTVWHKWTLRKINNAISVTRMGEFRSLLKLIITQMK